MRPLFFLQETFFLQEQKQKTGFILLLLGLQHGDCLAQRVSGPFALYGHVHVVEIACVGIVWRQFPQLREKDE